MKTLLYLIINFLTGLGCGAISICILFAAYPHKDYPWYLYLGCMCFAYALYNKLRPDF